MGRLGRSSAEVWEILGKPAHQAEVGERHQGGLVGLGCGSGASMKGQLKEPPFTDLLWPQTGT